MPNTCILTAPTRIVVEPSPFRSLVADCPLFLMFRF
nr:MAG TPA: hypothetical protein [Bacteriophage sp.]DAM40138.1 MAG TPA: hypothetical protein [Caudoviricetes sp.]DAS35614.1 MAG TPA: hypothetical protein [Caudoviricetes sp.]